MKNEIGYAMLKWYIDYCEKNGDNGFYLGIVAAKNLLEHIETLDKALNEACELIYDNLEICPYYKVNYDFGDCSECDGGYNCPKCWRKYLMKGEKK